MIQIDNITLWQGDCLNLMCEIPDKSVDMILCDLPYGTTDCKWDTVIPFKSLWEQYNRIIKNNGAIVLFGSEPFSTYLRMSQINEYKYDWIWIKNNCTGFAHSKNMPMKKRELISVFSKAPIGHVSQLGDKRMVYNPQGIIYEEKVKTVNRNKDSVLGARPNQCGKQYKSCSNLPTNILEFPRDKKTIHNTQKPVPLLEYLIKTYTNENETVLDNCMGSGSTGVACINTNRNFIGIELDDTYFEIAKKRIEEANSKSKT